MQNSVIKDIVLRKILDSRGGFTVEAWVNSGKFNEVAMVANSTSTGSHEVFAFPEGDVDKGIENFAKVKSKIIGIDAADQQAVDQALHEIGGDRFGTIGGNVATGISIASAKVAAKSEGIELYEHVSKNLMKGSGINKSIPRPLGNLIGGGVHSKNKMSIQEILISSKSGNFMKDAHINAQAHKALGDHISKVLGISTGINVEGAWITGLGDMENFELARKICTEVGGKLGIPIDIGADFASSEFYKDNVYTYSDAKYSSDEHVKFVTNMIGRFGMAYAEDPMYEDDFKGFGKILRNVGEDCLVCGDDLYTTNVERVTQGVKNKSTNAVLIKVNQIGTLTDTINVVKLANKSGMQTVVSHRIRETIDNVIAHLSVAFGSKFIKTGIVGGERVSKLNELARIEVLESQR